VNYRSVEQLAHIVRVSLEKFPWPPQVVAGLNPGGMLVGAQIAAYFGVPVIHYSQLWQDFPVEGVDLRVPQRVIVTAADVAGEQDEKGQIRDLLDRCQVKHNYFNLVAYPSAEHSKVFDAALQRVAMPRMFEWNWTQSPRLKRAVLSIDGVLCPKPPMLEEQQPKPYAQYIATAQPLFVPQVPVFAIATERLEKHHRATREWLAVRRIQYGQLFFSKQDTPQRRRIVGDHASKAAAYKKLARTTLFIESDDKHAQAIHAETKKLVLCTGTGIMYGAKM
jgi:hypothetical protein